MVDVDTWDTVTAGGVFVAYIVVLVFVDGLIGQLPAVDGRRTPSMAKDYLFILRRVWVNFNDYFIELGLISCRLYSLLDMKSYLNQSLHGQKLPNII